MYLACVELYFYLLLISRFCTGALTGNCSTTRGLSGCVRVPHSAVSFDSRAEENHEPCRMVAVERLDCRRRGVHSEVGAEPGLQMRDHLEVARVPQHVRADAKYRPCCGGEPLLQLWLIGEEFVLVHKLDAPGQVILLPKLQRGFQQVGID